MRNTPAPGANANTTGIGTSALILPRLPLLLHPSLELALLTTARNSNNGPQVFYTTQQLTTNFLKDPEFTAT